MGRMFITLAALIALTSCSDPMARCGEMCRLGVKSYTFAGGQPICNCNQPIDVCVILSPHMRELQSVSDTQDNGDANGR